jgi:hypothetical protein
MLYTTCALSLAVAVVQGPVQRHGGPADLKSNSVVRLATATVETIVDSVLSYYMASDAFRALHP